MPQGIINLDDFPSCERARPRTCLSSFRSSQTLEEAWPWTDNPNPRLTLTRTLNLTRKLTLTRNHPNPNQPPVAELWRCGVGLSVAQWLGVAQWLKVWLVMWRY